MPPILRFIPGPPSWLAEDENAGLAGLFFIGPLPWFRSELLFLIGSLLIFIGSLLKIIGTLLFFICLLLKNRCRILLFRRSAPGWRRVFPA